MPSKDFFEGLEELKRAMGYHVRVGLGKAALALLHDAIEDIPKVPLEEGTLRGSGSAWVGNLRLSRTDPSTIEAPSRDVPLVATVGFDKPYAAYLHEGIRFDGTHPVKHYKEPGSGPKYLENKANANREKYIGIVVESVRQGVFNNTL